MNPSFFGSRDRMLFGLYSPASGERQRRGVVICPPLMQEYLRSHRTCRLLAERLAHNGLDVLRFDYFGVGDSAGDSTEASIVGAVEDTLVAIDELRDIARVRKITLIGLRVGAAVAARAAARSKSVDGLVLWDPVSDGPGHLEPFQALATPIRTGEGGLEVQGFPLPAKLQEELTQLHPASFESPSSRVLLAVSEDLEEHRRLAKELSTAGSEVERTVLPNPPCWSEQGNFGVGAIPADLIQAIASWKP
jgi:pimeloyl-ACP methyl ester carboxylesterase